MNLMCFSLAEVLVAHKQIRTPSQEDMSSKYLYTPNYSLLK